MLVVPIICISFLQINFTITRAGLAGQILATTIKHEKPELEVRNMELIRTGESYKVQLADLEETLLQELAAAEGNILENKTSALFIFFFALSCGSGFSPHSTKRRRRAL